MQPILPKLKKGANCTLAAFNKFGDWDGRMDGEVYNLSESLLVDRIDPNYFDIDCIPSIWGRPILFEMALYDENHPLHSRILGEWRGFLAMLALRELRNLSNRLTASLIQLPNNNNARAGASDFLNALERLIPLGLLANDTTWYNLYVISFDKKPIGITSPNTLVCTAVDYSNRIKKDDLAWFNGRFLEDPIRHLVNNEKIALRSWLDQLERNINTPVDGRAFDHGKLNDLNGLINGFMNNLNVNLPANPVTLGNGMGMNIGLYQYIDRPIEAQPRSSNVMLTPRDGIPEPTILVVDRDIPNQWNVPGASVTVHDTITIATFPFNNPTGFANMLPNGFTLRADVRNDFFTDKLYLIDLGNAFPGSGYDCTIHHGNNQKTPILPVKSELLNYLSPDNLIERIRFESIPGGVRFHLILPLSGLGGQKDFEIEKEYSDSDIVSLTNVPVLEIWPDFIKLGWNIYYTYFFHQEGSFFAEPFVPNNKPEEHVINTKKIFKTPLFPEAIKCKSGDGKEAGLILLRPAQIINYNALVNWKVGVDFGTSGTTVYGFSDHPFTITFGNHLFQVTDSGTVRSKLFDDFIPSKDMKTPFLSIYHDFGRGFGNLSPLVDGHIYFLPDYRDFLATGTGIVTDLKWSNDPNIRIRTRAFLEQLCLQCSAEAASQGVNEIEWFFSYPAAFSAKDLGDFRTIWNYITNRCRQLTGITSVGPQEERESIAAAHYFANKANAPFATGMVCMDIGGGTSDISIWQNLNLLWHTSLRFAGRELFLDLIYHKPDFLMTFNVGNDILNLLRTLKRNGNLIAFYAQADAIIKDEGDKWLNNLVFYNAEDDVKKFKQIIAVGLSGLFYYIGLILNWLKSQGKYKEQMPDVYVGGNGSKIFDWLNVRDQKNTISNLFKSVLLRASNFSIDSKNFNVYLSKDPKHESAYGLVNRHLKLEGEEAFQNNNRVIAGEVFLENSIQNGWNEVVTAGRLSGGLEAVRDLPKLKDFLEAFNQYASSPISVISPINADEYLYNKVYQSLATVLGNFRGNDPGNIVVEPLFISELKALVKEMTARW